MPTEAVETKARRPKKTMQHPMVRPKTAGKQSFAGQTHTTVKTVKLLNRLNTVPMLVAVPVEPSFQNKGVMGWQQQSQMALMSWLEQGYEWPHTLSEEDLAEVNDQIRASWVKEMNSREGRKLDVTADDFAAHLPDHMSEPFKVEALIYCAVENCYDAAEASYKDTGGDCCPEHERDKALGRIRWAGSDK